MQDVEVRLEGTGSSANRLSGGLLVITELFLPTKGGTAVWFDEVYRRLGGAEVHVVTAAVPGWEDYDREHPNTVHRLQLARHWWLRPESLGMYATFFARSMRVALGHRISGVHAGRVLPEGLVGLAVARMSGRPLLVYAHGEEITTWRQPAKFRAMRYVFRNADGVVANSEFTRSELLKLGVREDRIALVNPGVDVRRFRPGLPCADLRASIGLAASQKLMLSVGRLSRRKGFDQTIRALPALVARRLDVHYAIVGIGEDREYLGEVARECGVADRVHQLGHVSPEDLPRWYNAADVLVMPNREVDGDVEGFGMVFIEAAACGKPAVAGRSGGTSSAVIDGKTGLLVDGASVDAVVDALGKILTDPGCARTLGETGYLRAKREFSWEQVAERILAVERVLLRQGNAK
jgi:phosphatidylinositol alpha-1,6-mannosyltransferase